MAAFCYHYILSWLIVWISFLPIFSSAFVISPEPTLDLLEHDSALHPERHHHQQQLSPQLRRPGPPSPRPAPVSFPLVIWHGLGDSFDGDGIRSTAKLVNSIFPEIYVKIVQLGDTGSTDRSATFFGNVTEQIQDACDELASDKILRSAPAINALGFSQGGQFLRAYVERCNSPPVRNLVTFGGQHNGISDFQSCASVTDFVCQAANALLKAGTWNPSVQSTLVPAQYYRDPEDLSQYLAHSNFLADVNNERKEKSTRYAENIARLNKFVMYMFAHDTTVVPKETSWFAEYNKTSQVVTSLEHRSLYKEDWLGLRKLAEKGGLEYDTLDGEHMQFSQEELADVIVKHFGPV